MPTFPFRNSVGDDLRALFQHDRVFPHSNQLGNTALDPGDGILEVRNSGGWPIGGLGHADNGASGVLVRDGSTWVTVDSVINNVASDVSSLTSRVGANETAIGNAVGRVSALESRAGVIESVQNEHRHRMDGHAQRIGALESRAGNIESAAAARNALVDARLTQLRVALNQVIDTYIVKAGGTPPDPINF